MNAIVLSLVLASGEFVLEGGAGSLVTRGTRFEIEVVGGNAHTCSLSGTVKGTIGTTSDENGDVCTIELTASDDAIVVKAKTEDACRAFCGVRAWFEGRYVKRIAACSAKSVKAARAAFTTQYRAKKYDKARTILEPVLQTCAVQLDRFEVMQIRNDLAVTFHHLGDDARCIEVLSPMNELANTPDDEVGQGEPAFEETLKTIAKAARTNFALCRSTPR